MCISKILFFFTLFSLFLSWHLFFSLYKLIYSTKTTKKKGRESLFIIIFTITTKPFFSFSLFRPSLLFFLGNYTALSYTHFLSYSIIIDSYDCNIYMHLSLENFLFTIVSIDLPSKVNIDKNYD